MSSAALPQMLGSSGGLLEELARARPVNSLCSHLCTIALAVPSARNSQSTPTHASKSLQQCPLLYDPFSMPSPTHPYPLQPSPYSTGQGYLYPALSPLAGSSLSDRLKLRFPGAPARPTARSGRMRACLGSMALPLFLQRPC